jgi:flavin-binding protein dodecin
MMLKPGASPTLMNAVAKNALDRNSDTIQQVEETTPTAG